MAAYFIVDLDISDAEGFKAYQQQVGATIEHYGGKYLVRGAAHEVIEGDWNPHRLVVLEFPSVEQFWRWYNSEEYTPLKAIREKTAITQGVVVQGV